MNEKVWNIIDKSKYTDEGIKEIEAIYDFLNTMVKKVVILPMKAVWQAWNESPDETFVILRELVNKTE